MPIMHTVRPKEMCTFSQLKCLTNDLMHAHRYYWNSGSAELWDDGDDDDDDSDVDTDYANQQRAHSKNGIEIKRSILSPFGCVTSETKCTESYAHDTFYLFLLFLCACVRSLKRIYMSPWCTTFYRIESFEMTANMRRFSTNCQNVLTRQSLMVNTSAMINHMELMNND